MCSDSFIRVAVKQVLVIKVVGVWKWWSNQRAITLGSALCCLAACCLCW
jgi:hypothetical protein